MGFFRKNKATGINTESVVVDGALTKAVRIMDYTVLTAGQTVWHNYESVDGFAHVSVLNAGSMYGYTVQLYWSLDGNNVNAVEDIVFTAEASARKPVSTRVSAPYVAVYVKNDDTVNANDISGVSLYFQAV